MFDCSGPLIPPFKISLHKSLKRQRKKVKAIHCNEENHKKKLLNLFGTSEHRHDIASSLENRTLFPEFFQGTYIMNLRENNGHNNELTFSDKLSRRLRPSALKTCSALHMASHELNIDLHN